MTAKYLLKHYFNYAKKIESDNKKSNYYCTLNNTPVDDNNNLPNFVE